MKLESYESTIGQHFRSVLGYIDTNHGIAEISTSHAKFLDMDMFGITLVKENVHDTKRSKCVNSMEEVEKYIEDLNYENHDALVNLLHNLK